jgi:hypothetical protein
VAHRADVTGEPTPHRAGLPVGLVELAAGRDPEVLELDDRLLAAAREHRVAGLLWSWVREHDADPEPKAQLAVYDLYVQAHLQRVSSLLSDSVERLSAVGLEVVTIKGVTAEARWYRRPGERPCSDVDLLLGPHQLDRAAEAVAALQPDHPWLPYLDAMVASGRVQSATLQVEGLEVDLHFDLLKLGIPTRQAHELWSRTRHFTLPDGRGVRVLDDTTALLHLLVHLNKDRFQRLLGYADVPRIIAAGQVDWVALLVLAEREGLEIPVLRTLETVLEFLRIPWPDEIAPVRRGGWRSMTWSLLWRPGIRLRGREGRMRFRKRQDWIPMLARGRTIESVAWWARGLVPPSPTVEAHYRHIRGPYLWKLGRGRIEAMLHHRRSLVQERRRAKVVTVRATAGGGQDEEEGVKGKGPAP